MTGEWIEAPGSAGAVFLFWHFLMLGLCITGLLLERILRRRNAHARSALLRSTLALALAIPLACTIWSALPARVAPLKVTVEDAGSTSQALPRFPEVDWNQVAVWRPLVTDIEQVPQNLLPIKTAGIPLTTIAYALFLGSSVLASLYLFGRFIAAVARCAALRHLGKPLAAADEERYRCVAAAMGVSAPPALTVKGLESPILLGFFRPAILLPEGMALRDEIFSHELTHLRRHDLMWHLLARITTMLMPLQPGFWLLKKALERADEDVCDDAVLVHGADAANYARLLLHVAESQHAPNPDLCLPMAAFRSQLERRLNRLLDATRPLARRLSVSVLCLGLGPLLAAGVLASAIFLDTERSVAADGETASTTTLPPGKPTASSADSPTQAALTFSTTARRRFRIPSSSTRSGACSTRRWI